MRIALRLKQLGERRVAANSEAGFVVLVALLLELAAARAVQPTGAASSQHAAAAAASIDDSSSSRIAYDHTADCTPHAAPCVWL
jgi:hypothetical protein